MEENHNDVPAKAQDKRMIACIGIAAVVIALNFFNFGWYILYPFALLYTFVHEMGHGISAVLMGGDFVKFEMWSNGSGVATYSGSFSRLADAFVAFGGLIAPAIMAAIFLLFARRPKLSRIGLYISFGICALSIILVVRNLFGIFFVALCGGAAFALAKLPKSDKVPQYSMLVLAMTLCTMVFSRGDYLFTEVAHTTAGDAPSDVACIANDLFLPYWFWGGLIAAISVAILFFGIRGFFRSSGAKPAPKAIEE